MIKSRNIREKKKKIIIRDIEDFNKALKEENYIIADLDKNNIENEIIEKLNIESELAKAIGGIITKGEIEYRAKNIEEYIDYINKETIFEKINKEFLEILKPIKSIKISRVEYDRVFPPKEDVREVLAIVEKLKPEISEAISDEEYMHLEMLEKEIDKEYIYTKDIELLKNIILFNNYIKREEYDTKSSVKSIYIDIPREISINYIKPTKGSIEYYNHINSNIQRLERLIKNLDSYIEALENGNYVLNQTKALQDTINLAFATYEGVEFRAISGWNDVFDYCKVVEASKGAFKSRKVNKLGEIGVGYNRINDSEKKILEEINRRLEEGTLKDNGELTIYSKWEPCDSCYYVMSQFLDKYPKIKIKVKYRGVYSRS